MTTRYSLIDPLLRVLGWDTEDPNMVAPKYASSKGRADYALFKNEAIPTVIIKTKNLGDPLESAAEQALKYCMIDGMPYFTVTYGDLWRVYKMNKPGPLHDKLIQEFKISRMKPAEVCIKMLILWRRNIGMHDVTVSKPRTQPTFGQSTSHVDTGRTEPSHSTSWKSIVSLTYIKNDSNPTQIKFPDGSVVNIRTWVDVLVKAATRLIENNHITKDHYPIKSSRSGTLFLVSTEPTHGNKKPFQSEQKIRGLYLECNCAPKDVLDKSVMLVKHARLDPQNLNSRHRCVRHGQTRSRWRRAIDSLGRITAGSGVASTPESGAETIYIYRYHAAYILLQIPYNLSGHICRCHVVFPRQNWCIEKYSFVSQYRSRTLTPDTNLPVSQNNSYLHVSESTNSYQNILCISKSRPYIYTS